MKKRPDTTTTHELDPLITEVRGLIRSARRSAVTTVNTLQVLTNFKIGRRIVEYEQKGEKRAEYGKELLKALSVRLTEEFGRGFSKSNLAAMRSFYLSWFDRVQIFQKPSGKLINPEIWQKASAELAISEKLSWKSPFTLSWSHYVLLLTIKNIEERCFYETEATNEGWSLPELKRQVASSLYERLALCRDKKCVRQLANKGQIIVKPEDMLKEPYELTLPADANIQAREYQLYLPSKEVLRQKLLDWALEQEMGG